MEDSGSVVVVEEVRLETASQFSGQASWNDVRPESVASSFIVVADDSASPSCIAARSQQFDAVLGEAPRSVTASITVRKGVGDRQLQDLLKLADENGAFSYSYELRKSTGITRTFVKRWAKEDWGASKAMTGRIRRKENRRCQPRKSALCTALVLAHLRREYGSAEPSWGAAALKAEAWLQGLEAEWSGCAAGSLKELLQAAMWRLDTFHKLCTMGRAPTSIAEEDEQASDTASSDTE